jgi:hypothetical protein
MTYFLKVYHDIFPESTKVFEVSVIYKAGELTSYMNTSSILSDGRCFMLLKDSPYSYMAMLMNFLKKCRNSIFSRATNVIDVFW